MDKKKEITDLDTIAILVKVSGDGGHTGTPEVPFWYRISQFLHPMTKTHDMI